MYVYVYVLISPIHFRKIYTGLINRWVVRFEVALYMFFYLKKKEYIYIATYCSLACKSLPGQQIGVKRGVI